MPYTIYDPYDFYQPYHFGTRERHLMFDHSDPFASSLFNSGSHFPRVRLVRQTDGQETQLSSTWNMKRSQQTLPKAKSSCSSPARSGCSRAARRSHRSTSDVVRPSDTFPTPSVTLSSRQSKLSNSEKTLVNNEHREPEVCLPIPVHKDKEHNENRTTESIQQQTLCPVLDVDQDGLHTTKEHMNVSTDDESDLNLDIVNGMMAHCETFDLYEAEKEDAIENRFLKEDKLTEVENVSKDVSLLAEKIEKCSGDAKSKEYLYLDEMLTKCLLKLDEISTHGIDEVRKARKALAVEINKKIETLEELAIENRKHMKDITDKMVPMACQFDGKEDEENRT